MCEPTRASNGSRSEIAGAAGERFEAWAALGGGGYHEASDRGGLAAAVRASLEAPKLRFTVIDAAGVVVAVGVVDGEPVLLPGGRYRVTLDGGIGRAIELTVRPEALTTHVLGGDD